MFSKIVLEPCLSKRTLAQVLMTSILLVSSVLHLQYPRLVHCCWVGLPLRIICKLDIFLFGHFLVEAFGADVFQHRYYFHFLWHLERVYMYVCVCTHIYSYVFIYKLLWIMIWFHTVRLVEHGLLDELIGITTQQCLVD
jgi:hypothetical protein